jgi:hypothetical protein
MIKHTALTNELIENGIHIHFEDSIDLIPASFSLVIP